MTDAQELDPDRPVRYVLTWPASMAEGVARTAKAHTMPMSVWLRELIRAELERDPAPPPPEDDPSLREVLVTTRTGRTVRHTVPEDAGPEGGQP